MTWLDRAIQWYRIEMIRPYIREGVQILDIGCADGALFRQHHAAWGLGLDPFLEREEDHGRYALVKGSFPEALPAGEPPDLITLLAVVEHVSDEELPKLAWNCGKVLKPAGRVVITVPHPLVDSILALLKKFRLIHGMSLEQHHRFDVRKVPLYFGEAGLKLERHRRFQLGLNNLFVFRK